ALPVPPMAERPAVEPSLPIEVDEPHTHAPVDETAVLAEADTPEGEQEGVVAATPMESPLEIAVVAAAAPPILLIPATAAPLPLVTPPTAPARDERPPAPMPRRVDVAQVHERASEIHVPQLHEPGLVPGGPSLADKTAAMQVVLPPPARPTEQELAMLQADAPSELTVRLGSEAVGKVSFRISEARSIDVQLSGLLDVLADRFASEDFARLRSATAADHYVPLDSLRAIGLTLRYDPVYDELRVSV